MKRLSKILAIVLALVLVIGVVPAAAASENVSLTKTKKTIFVDGCKGTTAAGKNAKYYSYANIKKIVKNFDSKTMDIKLDSSDTSIVATDDKKDRVTAVAPGKAAVTVNVFNKKGDKELLLTKSIVVTVKKNATASTLLVSGIKDGDKFKVNDSVKVTLTRKSGSDTDLRRLVSTGDGVQIEEAGTRKFKVTFTKAGTFSLVAESYMSEKYSGTTASKSFAVTVEDDKKEEEKKEEEKKEEEKKETKLEAAQISADSFKLTGSAVTSSLTKESIKIYYMIGGVEVTAPISVKEVSVTENTATVTMMSDFVQGETYYVPLGEEKASFTTAQLPKDDPVKAIKSIVFKTHTATINENVDIDFIYLDANGIDITNYVKSDADARIQLEDTGNGANAYVSGRSVNIYEKGKIVTLKATLLQGYDLVTNKEISVTAMGNVAGVEKEVPKVASSKYTFTNDGDAVYLKSTDAVNTTICVGDTNYALEVLFTYSDKSTKTPVELGAVATSVNESVLMIGGKTASGGDLLIPNSEGETYIKYKVGEQEIGGFKVVVRAARKASRIEVVKDKEKLNINPVLNDSLEISAIVRDQYGDAMNNEPLIITQREASQKDVSVSFGSFLNGKLVVEGVNCAILGNNPVYQVLFDITNGNGLTATNSFYVSNVAYDPTKLNSYSASLEFDGDLNINTALAIGKQKDKQTNVYINITSNGFSLEETKGILLDKAPTSAIKASDYSKVAGDCIVAMTIQYRPEGGTESFITSGVNIDTTSFDDCIVFDPVSSGKKLGKGVYTIRGYIITLGETSSTIKQIVPVRVITVKDDGREGSYKVLKEKTDVSGSDAQKVADCFEFYYDGSKLDPSLISYVDATTGDNTYVRSVTFTLSNDDYGSFTVKIPVDKLIRTK